MASIAQQECVGDPSIKLVKVVKSMAQMYGGARVGVLV